jgi:hypothetical protein
MNYYKLSIVSSPDLYIEPFYDLENVEKQKDQICSNCGTGIQLEKAVITDGRLNSKKHFLSTDADPPLVSIHMIEAWINSIGIILDDLPVLLDKKRQETNYRLLYSRRCAPPIDLDNSNAVELYDRFEEWQPWSCCNLCKRDCRFDGVSVNKGNNRLLLTGRIPDQLRKYDLLNTWDYFGYPNYFENFGFKLPMFFQAQLVSERFKELLEGEVDMRFEFQKVQEP